MKKLLLALVSASLTSFALQAGVTTEFVIKNNLPKENEDEFVLFFINHTQNDCPQARTSVAQGKSKTLSSGTYKKFGVITTPCCIKSIEIRVQDMSRDKNGNPKGTVTSIFEMTGAQLDAKLQDIALKSLTKGSKPMKSYGDKNGKGSCGGAHVEIEVGGLYDVEIL